MVRYQCKVFGQDFQRPDGSFYSRYPVTCQANKTWSSSVIPHPCRCELRTPSEAQNLDNTQRINYNFYKHNILILPKFNE